MLICAEIVAYKNPAEILRFSQAVMLLFRK